MRSCILALVASLTTTHLASQERTEPRVEGVLAGRLTDLRSAEMHTSAAEMIVEVAGHRARLAFWSPGETWPRLRENLGQHVIIEFKQGLRSRSGEALSEALDGTLGIVSEVRLKPKPPVSCALDPTERTGKGETIKDVTLVQTQRRNEDKRPSRTLRLGFQTADGTYRQVNVFQVDMYDCLARLTEAGRPVDLTLAPSVIEGLSHLTGLTAH